MEQEPYEFWIGSMNPESKGKATYGAVREHAFPRFKKILADIECRSLPLFM